MLLDRGGLGWCVCERKGVCVLGFTFDEGHDVALLALSSWHAKLTYYAPECGRMYCLQQEKKNPCQMRRGARNQETRKRLQKVMVPLSL
jgi:hypothetical protein